MTDATGSQAVRDHSYAAFDHNDPTRTAAELRALHDEMRERCPVAHSDQHDGFAVLTRYEHVRNALNSPKSYSSADGVFIPPSGVAKVPALEFDEPEHSQWRALMGPPLTVRAVRALEPTITEVVDLLIDDFASTGSADLVTALTEPMPALVIGRMVGFDQERSLAARRVAADLFAAIGTPAFPSRYAEFAAFTDTELAARRRHPRNDFLTALATGTVEGVDVDDDGVTGLLIAYLVGGHHSTSSGTAGLLRHMLTEPGLRAELQNSPDLLGRAVEESLRINTPLQYFARTTTAEIDIHGAGLVDGQRVLLDLAAANRDPRKFVNPAAFDLHRTHNPHVAFGGGMHMCQGMHLARAEMRIATGQLLKRLPDLVLTGDAPEVHAGGKLVTTAALPVTFSPEKN